MFNCLQEKISFIDMYGQPVSLLLNDETTSKTTIGGLLTFLTVASILSVCIIKGMDTVYHRNPVVNNQDELYLIKPFIELNKWTLPMAFSLQDCDQKLFPLPSRYFQYEVHLNTVFNNNNTHNETYFETEKCTFGHFPNLARKDLENVNIEAFDCIKQQNITIGGGYDEESISYLVIRIKFCKGPGCATMDEIKEYMMNRDSPFSWNIYFQNTIINSNNYDRPISYFITNFWRNMKFDTNKMFHIYLKENEISTDSNIFLGRPHSTGSISYSNTNDDSNDMLENSPSLVDINIFLSDHKTVYYRKYLKVQEILSLTGGFAKALKFISHVLTYYLSRFKMNQKIFNKIFNFEESELRPKKRSTSINSIVPHPENNVSIQFIENSRSSRDESIKRSTAELKFSSCDILTLLFCRPCLRKKLRNKLLIYKKCSQNLNQILDITNLTKKIDDMEKLKFILLKEHQVALFHYLDKTHCSIDEEKCLNYKINQYKNLPENPVKLESLISSFKEKFKFDKSDIIDLKLVELLNEEMKSELYLK